MEKLLLRTVQCLDCTSLLQLMQTFLQCHMVGQSFKYALVFHAFIHPVVQLILFSGSQCALHKTGYQAGNSYGMIVSAVFLNPFSLFHLVFFKLLMV